MPSHKRSSEYGTSMHCMFSKYRFVYTHGFVSYLHTKSIIHVPVGSLGKRQFRMWAFFGKVLFVVLSSVDVLSFFNCRSFEVIAIELPHAIIAFHRDFL